MTRVLAAALGVAAVNVSATQWVNRRAGLSDPRFWRLQALVFLFRFATFFGAATGVWALRRRLGEVAAFVIVAALGQLAGQIFFLLRQRRRDRESGRRLLSSS